MMLLRAALLLPLALCFRWKVFKRRTLRSPDAFGDYKFSLPEKDKRGRFSWKRFTKKSKPVLLKKADYDPAEEMRQQEATQYLDSVLQDAETRMDVQSLIDLRDQVMIDDALSKLDQVIYNAESDSMKPKKKSSPLNFRRVKWPKKKHEGARQEFRKMMEQDGRTVSEQPRDEALMLRRPSDNTGESEV